MSNFANTLKSEFARVARKEMKDDIVALRKASVAHRSEMAALKRQIKALASAARATIKISQASASPKAVAASGPEASKPDAPRRGRKVQFSKERIAAKRKDLGLTQKQMAQLLDASALSVYKWETGSVVPRAAQLAKIVEVLKFGNKEALARLT